MADGKLKLKAKLPAVLHIDTQTGSDKLIPIFEDLKLVPAAEFHPCRMPSADAKWTVNGVRYGVEVKHLGDIIRCISDGRFVTQLRRMQESFDTYWLLVIDDHKAGGDGMLMTKKMFGGSIPRWIRPYGPHGKHDFTYAALLGWLTTMELAGGCHLWTVPDDKQACYWITAKYQWSKKKKHKSLESFDMSRPAPRKRGKIRIIGKPNEVMCMLNAVVPKISWEKGKALSRKFASIQDLVAASNSGPQYLICPGIGAKLAADIVSQIRKKTVRKD